MSYVQPSTLYLALTNFDELPDSAFVSIKVVASHHSISRATIWRQVRDGILPAPHKLGKRSSRWQVGELRAALAAQNR